MNRVACVLPIAMLLVTWHAIPRAGAVQECFVAGRVDDPQPAVSDQPECRRKSSPASTFKIPHALIALQTGVVRADTTYPWNGTRYDYETWQRDHTLESAIKYSVYPFFQETARLIGRERMRHQLKAIGYGSDRFDGALTTFWVNGDLEISPLEQFEFLQRLFSGRIPVDPQHVATIERALRMPPGQILNAAGVHPFPLAGPAGSVLRAKTGNTRLKGERVSWLVGALDVEGLDYVFAARARSSAPLPGTAGAEVARRGLNGLVRER
ncbi:MAG TPA: penicillin-binding transpeptidase domain-containing protein [Vicinamibacterales bacterium]|nr:penicillin-binding transpeptidase domain-containing protein [Vicinamibacterales bacterium]